MLPHFISRDIIWRCCVLEISFAFNLKGEGSLNGWKYSRRRFHFKKTLNHNKTNGAIINNIECSWCFCLELFFFLDLNVKAKKRRKKTFVRTRQKLLLLRPTYYSISFLFSSPKKLGKHIYMWVVKARELDEIIHEWRNLMDLLLFGLIKQMKNQSIE